MDGRFIHHNNFTNYGLGISKTLKCDAKNIYIYIPQPWEHNYSSICT